MTSSGGTKRAGWAGDRNRVRLSWHLAVAWRAITPRPADAEPHGGLLADDNVVVEFRLRGGRDNPPPEVVEMLHSTIAVLDDLRGGFERIKPSLHWSAARWSAHSMSFRMQRAFAERQLAELHRIDPSDWPDTVWASQVSLARFAFEQQLHSIACLLDVLLHIDMPPDELAWQMERFTSEGKGFLGALSQLREVIVTRYPQISRPS
jgi:hypothetical protein